MWHGWSLLHGRRLWRCEAAHISHRKAARAPHPRTPSWRHGNTKWRRPGRRWHSHSWTVERRVPLQRSAAARRGPPDMRGRPTSRPAQEGPRLPPMGYRTSPRCTADYQVLERARKRGAQGSQPPAPQVAAILPRAYRAATSSNARKAPVLRRQRQMGQRVGELGPHLCPPLRPAHEAN